MKITLADLMPLAQALIALGGRQVEATNGDAKVVITKPYDIDGPARYAIAKNRSAAKSHLESVDDEREALFAKYAGDATELKAGTKEQRSFNREMTAFLRREVEFNAHRFPISALKIGTNQLDPGVIEALLPILDGEI